MAIILESINMTTRLYIETTPYPISVDRAEGINVGLIGELA